ncbi:MAG TPA: transcriptional regulator [Acidimicrobiales bacterium]|nr:transcriptional regulator [Acidimicrobiales bacterium]
MTDQSPLGHRNRLRIVAAALPEPIPFTSLRELVGLTDGNLNAHLRALIAAGFVTQTKTFSGASPQTTITVTPAGKAAFDAELDELTKLSQRPPTKPNARARTAAPARALKPKHA